MEGKDAEKMDSESPFRLSSGCLFVDVGGLSDDGMLCFRPGIEHAPGGCSLRIKVTKEQYQFPLGTTAWRISEEYGWRKDPLNGKEAFHKGVDLACASGTIVLAGADGIVAAARHSQSYGNYLRLSHAKRRRNALCSHAVSLCPDGGSRQSRRADWDSWADRTGHWGTSPPGMALQRHPL